MTEGGGGNDRDKISGNEAAHPERLTSRARSDGRWLMEGGNTRLKVQTSLLYADDGMVASTDLVWLHIIFDMLTGLFYWAGLKMNVRKTVGMVCHPYRTVRVRSEKSYTLKMTGVGQEYKERQRERVSCPECGKNIAGGHWIHTAEPRTELRRDFQYRREKGKARTTSPGLTGWSYQQGRGQGNTQLRGVVAGWKHGPPWYYTYGICMSETRW